MTSRAEVAVGSFPQVSEGMTPYGGEYQGLVACSARPDLNQLLLLQEAEQS